MLILNTISNNYKNLISCLLVTFGLLVSTSSQASASLLNQEVCASSDTLFIQSTNGENDKCNIVNDNNIPEFTVPGPQGILVNISSENVWLTRSVSGPFTDFDFDITLSELSWGDKKGKITGVSSSGDDNNFDTVFTNTSITINYDAGDEPGLADDLEVHFDLEVEHIMPDEEHSVVNPYRDLSEFKVNPSVPDITPSLESQLSNELKTLINNDRGTNFIFFDQVSNEIQILASLVNFPLLADSPFLVSNDFTNLHLVYRDAMGSNSGMDLGLLNQGGETF